MQDLGWSRSFWFFLISLFFYLILFFLKPINLFTADLGRHIINGREIVSVLGHRSLVFDTNYFSYTQSDFPFLNHHWLFGVGAWLVYKTGGFVSLQLINAVFKSIAVVVFMAGLVKLTKPKPKLTALVLTTFLALPLLTFRVEVRPETLSFLFTSLVYILLLAFWLDRLRWCWLVLITLGLQLIWVNSHIFFFFSFVLVGAFWLASVMFKFWLKTKQLTILGALLVGVSLVNPFSWRLLIFPTQILENYGYMIAENQSVWFMLKRFHQPIYVYVLILLVGLVFVLVSHLFFRWFRFYWYDWILLVVFAGASLRMNRLLPFLGLVSLPIFLVVGERLVKVIESRDLVTFFYKKLYLVPLITVIGLGGILVILASGLWLPPVSQLKLGLLPGSRALISFLVKEQVKGPIFNNYDIGSYLIYGLFPTQKVYVDNRPEAYPADFLQSEYVRPQESEASWRQLEGRYHFQTIVFYRLDQTPWAQPFLIRRIKDKSWVPVYVDAYSLVLVKDSPENQALVERLSLPEEMFEVKGYQEDYQDR